MDDFGMLARDFGFKPQGKSAPMAPSKSTIGIGSDGGDRRGRSSSSSSFLDDHNNSDSLLFSDVFGGPPKYSSTSTSNNNNNNKSSSPDYDSIFKNSSAAASDSKPKPSVSAAPVYDKPVYDDDIDIFDGLPGLKSKSTSASVRYDEDVFSSLSSPPKKRDQFDDLLGNFGRSEKVESKSNKSSGSRGFDDLLPGFGGSSPTGTDRPSSDSSQTQKPTASSKQPTASVMEDPFVDLGSTSTPVGSSTGLFTDPLEEISKLGNSGSRKVNGSSVRGGVFDDIDPLNGFGKSMPAFSPETIKREKDGSPSRTGSNMSGTHTFASKEPVGNYSFKTSESQSQKKMPVDSFQDFNQTPFGQTTSSHSFVHMNPNESTSQTDMSPGSEEDVEPSDDVWLTVSDIPLFTQPTSAPPPSRPPPVLARASKSEKGFFSSNSRGTVNEFSASQNSSQYSESPKLFRRTPKSPVASQIDELEDFAMGGTRYVDERAEVHSSDDLSTNSVAAASAAAMKEAMDRAEAKFRHAKEVRERESVKAARNKEAVQLEKDEQDLQDAQERELRENHERLDRERRQRESEEREREQMRLEKERERQMARQAVERANREARERAAAEARLKAERTAVEKANAEARERAERAAVQRAQAEARERAAGEARERAERAAAEARERANADAREKARAEAEARRRAERAAVERAAAEARERAATEARERAAAAARVNQQKNDNDLESFFSMGSRPSSAPRPRTNPSAPVDPQFQSKGGPEGSRRTSVGTSSNMRKASSTTNIVDDLSSIFGAPSSGEFQDVEGESEERRRARLERHQRTQERAAKALAEKNQRDLQTQRDQQERHRIAETLDIEIKRWSAGKEGNLRALLSTLQYVLWPECGWQAVSLTDLITGASVKKVYRKATLCIHPDKVQQKGANLQQKYIAEKVFDLLKEAWNKFNSEELF